MKGHLKEVPCCRVWQHHSVSRRSEHDSRIRGGRQDGGLDRQSDVEDVGKGRMRISSRQGRGAVWIFPFSAEVAKFQRKSAKQVTDHGSLCKRGEDPQTPGGRYCRCALRTRAGRPVPLHPRPSCACRHRAFPSGIST